MNRFINKFVSEHTLVSFLVLTVATILTYHQRISMYFWHDDYTIIYRFQQNIPIKFPYHFDAVLVKLLYGIFGLEYQPYVIINIILTIGVVYLVYTLASMLFKHKILALLSALIFTNGYVGQEETLQVLAAGLDTTLAMGMLLAALIFFLKYFKTFSKIWLFLTYLFFFLTLEIGAYRYGTALLIFIAVDWILLLKTKRKRLFPVLLHNLIFVLLFVLEFVYHPSKLILQYPLSYEKEASLFRFQNLDATQLQYVGNFLGTFWNMLFPRLYQDWLYTFFSKLPTFFPGQILWLPLLSLLLFFVLILILIRLLRRNTLSKKKFYLQVLLFLLTSLGWIIIINAITPYISDPVSRISIISGGVFLLFLSTLLLMKVPVSTSNALFSLTLFSVLLTFLYTQKMWYVYDSTQRYLYSVSFAPAFLPAFFITRELYKKSKNIRVKNIAWLIFLLPTLPLIFFPLLAGIKTQGDFKKNYSKHALRLFADLKKYIPEISNKKVIYIEGATKELNFSSLDAVRVGGLSSEAAIAVHYRTPLENIILPKEPGEVPKLFERNADLSPDAVFYFIYSDDGLEDNSKEFRQLLQKKSTQIIVSPSSWQIEPEKSLIAFSKEGDIKTQLPLLVRISIKTENERQTASLLKNGSVKEGKVEISWDYDTYGRLSIDKKTVLAVPLDSVWHNYEFTIPSSGLYLKSLIINYVSFPGRIYIGDMQIKHIR